MAIKIVHEWFRHTKSKKGSGKSVDAPDPNFVAPIKKLAQDAYGSHFSNNRFLDLWDTGRNRTRELIKIYGDAFESLDDDGVVAVRGPYSNELLRDVKEGPDCNIFHGPGVDRVDYATAIKDIAQEVRLHGFAQKAIDTLGKKEIYAQFPGLWKTAQDCLVHFRQRALSADTGSRYPELQAVGAATCMHGPTSDTVLMLLGKDIVEYLAEYGGTVEGGQSGLLDLTFVAGKGEILEAKLRLQRGGASNSFTLEPRLFNEAPRQY